MKKLKIFALILVVILLCSCGPDWSGYAGTMEGYEYCHTEERDRAWEEDILFLAEQFLTGHPMLADADFQNYQINGLDGEEELLWSNIMFDADARNAFVEKINGLILQIPDLTNAQVIYEAQRLVASLEDLHSQIRIPGEERVPIRIDPFWEDTGVSLYAVSVPAEHEEILFGKLTSIDGVDIETVMAQFTPYISHENEYAVSSMMYRLLFRDVLEVLGLMEEDSVQLTFETADGTVNVEMETADAQTREQMEMLDHSASKTYTAQYRNEGPFWHEWLREDALYVRFTSMAQTAELTMDSFFIQIGNLLRDASEPPRVILDFRNNSGGYIFFEEWSRFVSALERTGTEDVYILIDNDSYSAAVSTPYLLSEAIDSAVLVGTPAGQPVNFYSYPVSHTMPNCRYSFSVSCQYKWYAQEGCDAALMPDILVWPTIDDYKSGVDTVLEYVLSIE